MGLKLLRDSQGEVAQIAVLGFGTRPLRAVSAEEALHLDTTDPSCVALAEDDPVKFEDAFAVLENLQFTIRLASVVKSHALGDRRAYTGSELDQSSSDGVPKRVVARRSWNGGALFLVCWESFGRREVEVRFPFAIGTPHEPGRETGNGMTATGTCDGTLGVVTAVNTRELTAHVELEPILEENGVPERHLLRGGDVNLRWTWGVERNTTRAGVSTRQGGSSFRIRDLQGFLAIGCAGVAVREGFLDHSRAEGVVAQRESIGKERRDGP